MAPRFITDRGGNFSLTTSSAQVPLMATDAADRQEIDIQVEDKDLLNALIEWFERQSTIAEGSRET